MKKIMIMLMLTMLVPFVAAHGEEDFATAEQIIQDKVPCEELTNEQLEILGDYYMEQMHPGEQHERMDAMMGGEGSESLQQMHINMGLSFYCGEHTAMNPGMMNTMMGRQTGMMGQDGTTYQGPGMMQTSTNFGAWQLTIIIVALIAVVATFIIYNQRQRGEK